MKNRIRLIVLLGLISVFCITIYGKVTETKYKENQEQTGFLSNLNELGEISAVMDLIIDQHVQTNKEITEDVTKDKLLDGALRGMLNELKDPHSIYFTKKEMGEFSEDMSGKFAGVGMQINKKAEEYLNVVSPIEGTPAFRAGIKPHDKIAEIDGESTLGLTTNECMKKLKGEPGTEVKLKIVREGLEKPFEVTLKRAIIELKYVRSMMLDEQIGVLRLTQFVQNVSTDVSVEVEKLLSQGMKGMILDLRFNPGGALDEAIKVASLFIDKGHVVSVQDKKGQRVAYERLGKYLGDFPIVVLLNGGSASASEIVAGAIKDYKRGILVGEKSFGKGSVQNVIPLPNGGGVKLTIAKYYTPLDIDIDKKGIEPDVEIEEPDAYLFFDGYITNVDKESKKENKEELINMIGEVEGEEKKEELKKKIDLQQKTAENILKGILMSKRDTDVQDVEKIER